LFICNIYLVSWSQFWQFLQTPLLFFFHERRQLHGMVCAVSVLAFFLQVLTGFLEFFGFSVSLFCFFVVVEVIHKLPPRDKLLMINLPYKPTSHLRLFIHLILLNLHQHLVQHQHSLRIRYLHSIHVYEFNHALICAQRHDKVGATQDFVFILVHSVENLLHDEDLRVEEEALGFLTFKAKVFKVLVLIVYLIVIFVIFLELSRFLSGWGFSFKILVLFIFKNFEFIFHFQSSFRFPSII
jgi:hypothetical protein